MFITTRFCKIQLRLPEIKEVARTLYGYSSILLMADNRMTNKINGHVLKVTAPGVDYGLKNDDGFDPSKYDFYNPSNRSATAAFVLHLDEYAFTSILSCCIASA